MTALSNHRAVRVARAVGTMLYLAFLPLLVIVFTTVHRIEQRIQIALGREPTDRGWGAPDPRATWGERLYFYPYFAMVLLVYVILFYLIYLIIRMVIA